MLEKIKTKWQDRQARSRMSYNTLENKYQVMCEECDRKTIEIKTQQKINNTAFKNFEKATSDLLDRNLELQEENRKLKKENRELRKELKEIKNESKGKS